MAKIDDSVKKKVPELRFKGFTDEWEDCKLGELASFSKGNGYTKNDLVEFGDPIILYGRLYTKYETVIEKVDTFVNKKDKSIISEGSEVIVPASGESSEDISRASVVGKSGIILGGDLNIIKPINYIDSIFLALTISNGSQQKEMSRRAQGKSVVHLHNSDLKQVNILYPKLEEQQKIGSFFKQLDNIIALHQRKLDLLKEQKKGFLQKMFPKNGAKVPELRFAGFANDWEERKLEDISEIIDGDRGKNYPSGDDFKNNGHTLFLSAANVTKQGFVFKETQYITKLKSESLGSGKVILNDIILTSRGSIGHIGFYDKKTHEYIPQARINSGMLILRTDKLNSPSFIAQFLKSPWGIKQIKLISFGSAQPQLTKKDIKNFKIILPKMEEQEKIGSFFQKLDDTIALHQRKLDLLKEQKKGFLQKMFV
ncbi:restriction endonuclease subunit S [Lactococcus cremoris]|uniref:restriction endonuclease subunit S n=1 Tax=Lactococcus lactis subsp. cremoris TaxID=1359 RepID=UPI0022E3CE3B|nr:restriction endonuclease subunit S [Lactococcus cremoris]MDA2879927.1 restriction endonuclease subunit S [Lactococcus cremoris]MDA2882410.1 restriction endonuclease subunit S [Lactococcus cremoris]